MSYVNAEKEMTWIMELILPQWLDALKEKRKKKIRIKIKKRKKTPPLNHVEFTASWILTLGFVLVNMSEGAVSDKLIMCVDKWSNDIWPFSRWGK